MTRTRELPKGYTICRLHNRGMPEGRPCPQCAAEVEYRPVVFTPRIVVEMPWESARWLSKNRSLATSGKRIVVTEECARASLLLEKLIAIERPMFREDEITVTIRVVRPDRRSDAPNFVDRVCDAVKRAIAVDDVWFGAVAIPEIDAENPRLEVEVRQDGSV